MRVICRKRNSFIKWTLNQHKLTYINTPNRRPFVRILSIRSKQSFQGKATVIYHKINQTLTITLIIPFKSLKEFITNRVSSIIFLIGVAQDQLQLIIIKDFINNILISISMYKKGKLCNSRRRQCQCSNKIKTCLNQLSSITRDIQCKISFDF